MNECVYVNVTKPEFMEITTEIWFALIIPMIQALFATGIIVGVIIGIIIGYIIHKENSKRR